MQNNTNDIIRESRVLHTFTEFHMHQFIQRSKRRVAEGNCIIHEWRSSQEGEAAYYLKMNNFDLCKRVNESVFIRVRYPKSTAYLFFDQLHENMVYSLTALNQSPYLMVLQQTIIQHGTLVDYQSPQIKYEVKVRVDYHCDKILQNEVIINNNISTKIGKAIGQFFGLINEKVDKHCQEADKSINQRVDRFSRDSFSQETRSKWTNLKTKASDINDKLTSLVKPISTKLSQVAGDLKESYVTSENTYIKSFREFSKQTEGSINQGFKTQQKEEGQDQTRVRNGQLERIDSKKREEIEKSIEFPSLEEPENQRESLLK